MNNFAAYQSIDRMNASTIVHGLHSMLRLHNRIKSGGDEDPTISKELGTTTHVLLLEPEEFERRFVVMPDFHLDPNNLRKAKNKNEPEEDRRTDSKATTYYGQRVRDFLAANVGRSVVPREMFDKCLHAIEAIRSHHSAPKYLEGAHTEQQLLGEICGIPFKGRADIVGKGFLCDLKTTSNASPYAFGRSAANLNYDFQLAIYWELYRQEYGEFPEVKIIVQEVGGDYDTCVTNVPDIVLENAVYDVHRVCKDYLQCMESGVWPGVDKGKAEVDLYVPNWKMRDDDFDWGTVQ
jgi:exodeoxyribonuclease VIII